ncbi:uncharacterized protein EV420DRAFT_1696541 [Desarmillaria tabescens]|uniref:Uncharacterized protein n=1 Tax=Armillaria tabescens TaxID=1929756 RepID=A0AA39K461_ARMTA|nr:uncharacterized protein EV420DRAFT_1696541 [Desarmillaria tabescens]KAK0454017.1 hypothetical protein EV420DRAFT_1696541 [Desarmillaria tabescens]
MAIQADIPPDLTNEDKASMFQFLNAELNSGIFYALLHGIYTRILAVTLWNIFINKRWPIKQALVIIIVLLYALITINAVANWSFICSAFIKNGRSFWTIFSKFNGVNQAAYLEMGITASMSTILTDSYILTIFLTLDLVLLDGLGTLLAYCSASNPLPNFCNCASDSGFPMPYLSLMLATTLWCTLLIIFRILTVTRVRHGEGGRLRVYHHFIGVLVESSTLYSIALVLFLAFYIRNGFGSFYLDSIAGIAKCCERPGWAGLVRLGLGFSKAGPNQFASPSRKPKPDKAEARLRLEPGLGILTILQEAVVG